MIGNSEMHMVRSETAVNKSSHGSVDSNLSSAGLTPLNLGDLGLMPTSVCWCGVSIQLNSSIKSSLTSTSKARHYNASTLAEIKDLNELEVSHMKKDIRSMLSAFIRPTQYRDY